MKPLPSSRITRHLALAVLVQAVALAAVASRAGPLSAQTSTEGAPLELSVSPVRVSIGSTVTISGRTVTYGDNLDVSIRIAPEGGAKPLVTLTAVADPNTGDFQSKFDATTPGSYWVTASSPDEKSTAKAEFEVLEVTSLLDETGTTMEAAVALSDEGISAARTVIAGLPPSPATEEVTQKLDEATALLSQLDEIVRQAQDVMSDAGQAIALTPQATEEVATDLERLAAWREDTQAELARARVRLDRASSSEYTTCDRLAVFSESLATFSLVWGMIGSAVGMMAKMVLGQAVPALLAAQPVDHPGANAAKTAWAKANGAAPSVAAGLEGVAPTAQAVAFDLGGYAAKRVFSTFCQQFQGPVTAEFEAVFEDKGAPYWKYTVQLQGQVRLRFPKDVPSGRPVKLTGEFEGNATRFTFWEDIFQVEPRPSGMVVLSRQPITPVPFVNSAQAGLSLGLFKAGTPGYFNVPVVGVLRDGLITLEFREASVDFSDQVRNRLILIATNPALPIPLVKTFDFPIQKAHFILSRGTHLTPEFEVQVQGARSVIDRTFTREWVSPSGETTIHWSVQVRATSG